jgi:PAS domain S-box-containing protein
MGPMRVMIIDDDDVDRERLCRMLYGTNSQVEIIEAASADESLERLHAVKVDCVLLDYHLGNARGTDLLGELQKTSSKHCPIIMITGNTNERVAIEAVRQGVYDYLPKASLDRSQLNAAIEGGLRWAQLRTELRESEHRFQRLSESLPQLIWTCRPDGACNYLSRQWTQYTGESPQVLLERGPWSRVHADERQSALSTWNACLRSGNEFRAELRIRRKDDAYRWFDVRIVPTRDNEHQILEWIGCNTDVHENRILTQAFRRQAKMLDLAHDPILAWTKDGGIEFWNHGCEQLYGYSSAEALGQNSHELLHSEFPGSFQEFEAQLKNTGLWSGELRQKNKDGQAVVVSSRHQLIQVGGRSLVLEAHRDVTLQKKAAELQARSQKMEALGTLAGGIAHDFNNILFAITGHCNLAKEELPPEHPAQQNLTEIGHASERATQLVRRVLQFARQEEPKRAVVALEPVVSEALNLMRASLPAMIALRFRSTPGVSAVSADATQIHQIVVNLVTNAAHAIGSRAGTIKIALDEVVADRLRNDRPQLTEERYVCLSVTDDGCGIEPQDLKRIFDPFFTTKPVGQGTGLGLSAVHGIVSAHQGAIDVESTPGAGTTFRAYFPAIRTAAAQHSPSCKPTAAGRGQHILYVDDEVIVADLMKIVLNRLGYRVTSFTDPEQALRAFSDHPAAFELAITDLSMPCFSGFELARALRAIRQDIPVVLTTGFLTTEDEATARSIGIQQILLKPDVASELPGCLERIFATAGQPQQS